MIEEKFNLQALFPLYSEVKSIIPVLKGFKKSNLSRLTASIFNQTGTPQNPISWENPDSWIQERLTNDDRSLANAIWLEAKINPRYTRGLFWFINNQKLLESNNNDVLSLTVQGKAFLEDDPIFIKEIDKQEGIIQLLTIISGYQKSKKSDLMDDWSSFCVSSTKYQTGKSIESTLSYRLNNLLDRNLIIRESRFYKITDQGKLYLSRTETKEQTAKAALYKSIDKYNSQKKAELKELLGKINPYTFEKLIKELLIAMKYDDVEVTSQSGDKGIDVKAKYQFGISEANEVIQVKRHHGTIGRPILDQLRGVLSHHNAYRGTIITIGTFSSGCKEAALWANSNPITLIDGDMLVDLLIEHNIGIKKENKEILEIELDDLVSELED